MVITVLGIDPGMAGALAWLSDRGVLEVLDVPLLKYVSSGRDKYELDNKLIAEWLRERRADVAYLERVHGGSFRTGNKNGSAPRMGVSSAFNFGAMWGALRQACWSASIPVRPVYPHIWKGQMGLPAGADKSKSVERAEALFPDHPVFRGPKNGGKDGRAEAALIALWGMKQHKKILASAADALLA